MTRLMILGAGGFLGGHILSHLRAEGSHQVIVPARAQWDLRERDTLVRLMAAERPDLVLNLAAISSTLADRDALYQINAFGHLNLLEALAETGFAGRVFFTSSSNVYGAVPDRVVGEETRPLPMNHYSCAKLLGEHFCAMFRDRFETVILRPFNTIGTGQQAKFLVPKLVDHFARRAPHIELGNIDVARDFVDARDLAAMVALVIGAPAPAPVYNLANGEAVTLRALIEILAGLSGHRPEIRLNPDFVRARDITYQCGATDRIRALGHRRRFLVEDTLRWLYAARLQELGVS